MPALKHFARGLAALTFVFATAAGAADVRLLRERTPSERPSLVVLGVSHFANPGRDAVNVTFDDVLVPKRQKEIAELVDRLAALKPTRVVVEYPAAKQAKLDERYRAYRAGTYALTRNEIDQIGLRLAAKLGLDRVDAADWDGNFPGTDADYDFRVWANAHEQKERFDAIFDPAQAKAEEALLARSTIGEFFCELNRPDRLASDNRLYFDIALLGGAEENPGAAWVGGWHGRNLRIFANLVRIAAKPDDRVVAVFGAGHKFLLDQFADQSHAFKVGDARTALRCR